MPSSISKASIHKHPANDDICIIVMDWTANPSTGKKRPPNSDDLLTEQPLSKRLALLSLQLESNADRKHRKRATAPPRPVDDERMEVDNDNASVVYVHDIDEELGSDEDDDKKGLVFLPDIEKKLTRVPYELARGGGPTPQPSRMSTALVLYTVPSSLTVSKEEDGVRRAIIEARARIRQKQADEARLQGSMEGGEAVVDGDGGAGLDSGTVEEDPDAMDIE